MHNLWDPAHLKLNDLDFTFQDNPKVMRSTERQYMTFYMCCMQTLVIRCIIYEMQPLENYVTLISPLRVIQGPRSCGNLKDHIWLHICIISEILAKIDHKGPNLTFVALKYCFRLNPQHSYFGPAIKSPWKSNMMQNKRPPGQIAPLFLR